VALKEVTEKQFIEELKDAPSWMLVMDKNLRRMELLVRRKNNITIFASPSAYMLSNEEFKAFLVLVGRTGQMPEIQKKHFLAG
jgi:hypothetical protein